MAFSFFIKDILTSYGEEDHPKLILFDDFRCIDTREIIGEVSREIIHTKMRYAY